MSNLNLNLHNILIGFETFMSEETDSVIFPQSRRIRNSKNEIVFQTAQSIVGKMFEYLSVTEDKHFLLNAIGKSGVIMPPKLIGAILQEIVSALRLPVLMVKTPKSKTSDISIEGNVTVVVSGDHSSYIKPKINKFKKRNKQGVIILDQSIEYLSEEMARWLNAFDQYWIFALNYRDFTRALELFSGDWTPNDFFTGLPPAQKLIQNRYSQSLFLCPLREIIIQEEWKNARQIQEPWDVVCLCMQRLELPLINTETKVGINRQGQNFRLTPYCSPIAQGWLEEEIQKFQEEFRQWKSLKDCMEKYNVSKMTIDMLIIKHRKKEFDLISINDQWFLSPEIHSLIEEEVFNNCLLLNESGWIPYHTRFNDTFWETDLEEYVRETPQNIRVGKATSQQYSYILYIKEENMVM